MSDATLIGRQELGGYRLLREVGRGAMGIVFEAEAANGTRIALKVLAPPPLLEESERVSLQRRFLREAAALGRVDHPNVVRVFGAGEAEGFSYLAMEFLEGENLRQRLASGGPFSPEAALSAALQLLSALDAIHHAGIIHRDVKPENLVLLPDDRLKLTDFGVVWVANEATLTRTGGVLGSPAYMSPEQILGRPVDIRSDVFSAAATLYQLLADRLPFAGEGLMEMAHNVANAEPAPLPAHVPYGVRRSILRALQKSPAARFATAAEFSQALLSAQPAPAPRPTRRSAAAHAPTMVDPHGQCARHPGRSAIACCRACRRGLCQHCARGEGPPYYCVAHRPVRLFGIPLVRWEVALMALLFVLMLLCLSPLGYAGFRH